MENIKQLSSDYSNLIIGNIASGKTWITAELNKTLIFVPWTNNKA